MALELLTDLRVRTAKPAPGQPRLELRDTDTRGLELRVGKAGAKTWALLYTRQSDGTVRRVTIGPYPQIGLGEARQRAMLLKVRVEAGEDPAMKIQEVKAAPTFKELSDDWVRIHGPNKSARSLADNVSMLNRHVLPVIGAKKAHAVTKRDVLHLLDTVALKPDARLGKKKHAKDGKRKTKDVKILEAARNLSHRPARVYELVRSIFRWALSRDILAVDPTFGMKPPLKKERPRERALTAEEIKQFWKNLDETPLSEGIRLALKIALVTAQRIGEVANIVKSELTMDGAAPVWMIPGARAKNRESHRVPLSPLAVDLIRQADKLSADSNYLFPSPKEDASIGSGAATKGMQRARPTIALDDFRVHDLRRTAATGMAELGINPHTISLVLNHISAQKGTITSAVYVKYSYDKEKRDALDAWGRRLQDILAIRLVAKEPAVTAAA